MSIWSEMLTELGKWATKVMCMQLLAMSEEQLSVLLAKLQEDAGLKEKLKDAADLDAAAAIAKEAGFDVSKSDWLRHQSQQTLELSDTELEEVAGGLKECQNSNQTKGSCGNVYCATP